MATASPSRTRAARCCGSTGSAPSETSTTSAPAPSSHSETRREESPPPSADHQVGPGGERPALAPEQQVEVRDGGLSRAPSARCSRPRPAPGSRARRRGRAPRWRGGPRGRAGRRRRRPARRRPAGGAPPRAPPREGGTPGPRCGERARLPCPPAPRRRDRPACGASGTGASGSRKGTSRCTGPPGRATAAATARETTARRCRNAAGARLGDGEAARRPGRSGRRAPPCGMVWAAPKPCSSQGRSAVSATSGTPAAQASTSAGRRCAPALPEVTSDARPGWPDSSARPRAKKPATRSSSTTQLRSSGAASATARASGALREPGQRTTSRTPPRSSSWTSARDQSVLSEGMPVSPPPRRRGA